MWQNIINIEYCYVVIPPLHSTPPPPGQVSISTLNLFLLLNMTTRPVPWSHVMTPSCWCIDKYYSSACRPDPALYFSLCRQAEGQSISFLSESITSHWCSAVRSTPHTTQAAAGSNKYHYYLCTQHQLSAFKRWSLWAVSCSIADVTRPPLGIQPKMVRLYVRFVISPFMSRLRSLSGVLSKISPKYLRYPKIFYTFHLFLVL